MRSYSIAVSSLTAFTALLPGVAPAPLRADEQRIVVTGPMAPLTESAKKAILKQSSEIANPEAARTLLLKTCETAADSEKALPRFAIIHVLRWSDPDEKQKQAVGSENWYVFRDERLEKWSDEDFSSRNRIFGQKNITFLYVHLNRRNTDDYEPVYDIRIKKKTGANLLNLFSAAGLFSVLKPEAVGSRAKAQDFWNGGTLDINYVPSDIVVTPKIPGAEGLNPKTFDNEGRARWDVSVGVPVKKISETEFDAANNVINAKKIEKQNLLALLNIFPIRARDLKGSNLSWAPSLLTGVAVASQPLHKIFLGLGWGPHFASFYAGALFVKGPGPQTLKEGQPATPTQLQGDLKTSFTPQFAFGINVGARAVAQKLSAGK